MSREAVSGYAFFFPVDFLNINPLYLITYLKNNPYAFRYNPRLVYFLNSP